MADIIVTIILAILSYFFLIKPELVIKLLNGKLKIIKNKNLDKEKRDIRIRLGIFSLICFLLFLIIVLRGIK